MKIISYNVNGIRAAIKKGFVEWLAQEQPDILCLQEVKASPAQIDITPFTQMGYTPYWHEAEKKGYSGVAIFSKIQPVHITYGMGNPKYDVEGRVIKFDLPHFSILNVYMPSGTTGEKRQQFKYEWLDDFMVYLQELKQQQIGLLIGGDFNIAHRPIDIHNPVANKNSSGFLPQERAWMDALFSQGFVDLFRKFHPEPHRYTWWSTRANARARNLGWRIDYWVADFTLQEQVTDCDILQQVIHSDHCPVTVKIRV
ncbi:MAG: exodeoxyribonuclease III [Cytophagales bacterium]|nr:exodeoxyribonuclease III [Bernardetiaceae bacterium]MDW8205417.1 exodeoxyribonuclease III [Cytophagales bacterium]